MGVNNFLKRIGWPVLVACCLMVGCQLAANALKPRQFWIDGQGVLNLSVALPKQFGAWRMVENLGGAVVDPTVEAELKAIYSDTLNRTYVDQSGNQIMVSLAYGENQSSWNTAAHRPEFCYNAQGFEIAQQGVRKVQVPGRSVEVASFVGTNKGRIEAVTYWVTLADSVALPGIRRKLQQLKFGLQGFIVDGTLIRVSSLGANTGQQFDVQELFIKDWSQAMDAKLKHRFFGH